MYPNLGLLDIVNCTIYKEALLSGFAGEILTLNKTHIVNRNKNILHLNNLRTKINGVEMDYEHFFLTTDAPKMSKIEILGNHLLGDKDLLFISGFYNLEGVRINAVLSSYEQLEKLEKLREIRYAYCSNEKEL